MSVELHASDQSHQTLFTVGLVDLAAAGVERVVITERRRVGDGHWWTAIVYADGQCLEVSALDAFVDRPNQLVTLGYAPFQASPGACLDVDALSTENLDRPMTRAASTRGGRQGAVPGYSSALDAVLEADFARLY